MDWVTPESNVSDDPMDDWSQYSEISSASSDLIHGTSNSTLQFVRAGGLDQGMDVPPVPLFLEWLWTTYVRTYTRRILAPGVRNVEPPFLPVNLNLIFHQVMLAVALETSSHGLNAYFRLFASDRLQFPVSIPTAAWEFTGASGANQDLLLPISVPVEMVPSATALELAPPTVPLLREHTAILESTEDSIQAHEPGQDTLAATNVSERLAMLVSSEVAPVNSIQLRRSARSTKYDGFKVHAITDAGKQTSKVKPKHAPSITSRSSNTRPRAGLRVAVGSSVEPPPPHTPIRTIQRVGSTICGIPLDELSEEKLRMARDKPPPQA